MKAKNVIWGILLVFIGSLFILRNFDVIYFQFSWRSLLRLWPFIFVFIGISILPVKGAVKVVLTLIAVAVAAVILIAYPAPSYNWGPRWWWHSDRDNIENWDDYSNVDQSIIEPFDTAITEAKFVFDAAAGTFKIDRSTDELFEFNRKGGFGKYIYNTKELGSTREIKIEYDGGGRFIGHNVANDVEIKLNQAPVWDLNINVGAADMQLNLAKFMVRKVSIDGGASSIDLKLGNRSDYTEVDIESGASSITIDVPEAFACVVKTSTVLTSKSLEGFNKVADGTYVTENFSESTKNIEINIDAAVSSLTIIRH